MCYSIKTHDGRSHVIDKNSIKIKFNGDITCLFGQWFSIANIDIPPKVDRTYKIQAFTHTKSK